MTTACPPGPVRLKLAAIHPGGIDVTWNFPEQYGDAVVSVSVLKKIKILLKD